LLSHASQILVRMCEAVPPARDGPVQKRVLDVLV